MAPPTVSASAAVPYHSVPRSASASGGVRSEGAIAYEEIFGMPLIKVVKSETFGWYEKTLCYIIREAFEERVHIPRKHIHLVRDVDI